MKWVFTRITMNMDGVQFNIIYINGKCITIKKNQTHVLRPIVVDIFVAALVVVLPPR
jgi:hypothetical protein